MAKMYPAKLPREILDDRRKKAEVRTYRKLAAVLDDQYEVFYSSPWLGLDRYGAEIDGECDFTIAHPVHGILAVEVKGGGIDHDPETRRWTSTDHDGIRHKIKDPVKQAREAKYEILTKLGASRLWDNRRVRITHGVIFPGSATPRSALGADRPRELFCASSRFRDDLAGWVAERFRAAAQDRASTELGKDGLAALRNELAKPFQLHFTLGARIAEAAEEMALLLPRQYIALGMIEELPRSALLGGAGTGKTVLAMEIARRHAASGRRTLLTCFNKPLCREMQRTVGGGDNLKISHFHSLCVELAEGNGRGAELREEKRFSDKCAEFLIDLAARDPELRWDSIVIDEAQDWEPSWWVAIDSIMADGGKLMVFGDTNQLLYSDRQIPTKDLEIIPIRLDRNLRNTQCIHRAASRHYRGPEIIAEGPEGPEVIWVESATEIDCLDRAYEEIRLLVFTEEVRADEIAVLLPHSELVTRFEKLNRSSLELVRAERLREEAVIVDTVRRFKGLERPVVVVVLPRSSSQLCEMSYVAFTRASSLLVVVGTPSQLARAREGESRPA
jgi:hypothetical protein